jgi:hypothetical protein
MRRARRSGDCWVFLHFRVIEIAAVIVIEIVIGIEIEIETKEDSDGFWFR